MDARADDQPIYTIGHSNHALDKFLDLLKQHGIDALVDTRSHPTSKYTPHFNSPLLKAAVEAAGMRYVFLGEALGGRPKEERFYDAAGYVLYSEIAKSARFRDAIETLERR